MLIPNLHIPLFNCRNCIYASKVVAWLPSVSLELWFWC